MTIRINKPEVNLRQAINELQKPTGPAGELLLRANSTEEQQKLLGITGRKNHVINGSFAIWQRYPSATVTTNSTGLVYSADRWAVNTSAETMTISRQSNGTDRPEGLRSRYFIRCEVSTTGDFAGIKTKIENLNNYRGCWVTLSFWARGGRGTQGIVPPNFRTYVNRQSGSGIVDAGINGEKSYELTRAWKKYTHTFRLPYDTAEYNDFNSYIELFFQQTTTDTPVDFDIAEVQLEYGQVATPFEHRSYGEELALCQRYYQVLNKGRIGGVINETGQGIVTNQMVRPYMRTDPDITINGTIGFYYMSGNSQINTTISGAQSLTGYGLNLYKADGNTGDGNSFWCDLTSSEYLAFDAEL